MKKVIFALALGMFLALGIVRVSVAGETHEKSYVADILKDANVSVSGTSAFFEKYIWRGMRLDEDAVFQQGLTLNAFNGWSFNVWGNFDVANEDNLNSTEIDSTITYSKTFEGLNLLGTDLKPITLTGGHTYYDFPGTNTFSKETLLTIAYGSFLSPSVTWYHDYGKEPQGGGKGNYVMGCLAHSIEILPKYGITFDLSGHVGWNDKLFINGQGGDILATAGFTIPITPNLKAQPVINWSSPFGDVRHESDGNHNDYIFGGATLTYSM